MFDGWHESRLEKKNHRNLIQYRENESTRSRWPILRHVEYKRRWSSLTNISARFREPVEDVVWREYTSCRTHSNIPGPGRSTVSQVDGRPILQALTKSVCK
jgi:hypothetical protein